MLSAGPGWGVEGAPLWRCAPLSVESNINYLTGKPRGAFKDAKLNLVCRPQALSPRGGRGGNRPSPPLLLSSGQQLRPWGFTAPGLARTMTPSLRQRRPAMGSRNSHLPTLTGNALITDKWEVGQRSPGPKASVFWQDSWSGQTHSSGRQRVSRDSAMWTGWWLWPLVAVCTADQFRDNAVRLMQSTPVIDG